MITQRIRNRRSEAEGVSLLVIGWAVAACAALALATGTVGGLWQAVPAVALAAGLALIIGGEEVLVPSASTATLLGEARSARRLSAERVSGGIPGSGGRVGGIWPALGILALAAYAMGILPALAMALSDGGGLAVAGVVPLLILAYGYSYGAPAAVYGGMAACFILLAGSPATGLVPAYLAALAPSLVLLAWSRRSWFEVPAACAGTYLVLARLLLGANGDALRISVAVALSLAAVILFTVPFSWLRRDARERHAARWVIGASLAYLAFLPLAAGAAFDYAAWLFSLAVCAFVFAGYGAAGWWRYGRHSYAKYFGAASFGLTLLIAAEFPASASVEILLILVATLAIAAGFLARSYSARIVGLGLLAVAGAYFASSVLPADSPWPYGPVYLTGRVVTGLLLAASASAVATWYRHVRLSAGEAYAPVLAQFLYLAATGVVAALLQVEVGGLAAHAAWGLLGLAVAAYGQRRDLAFVAAGAGVLAAAGLASALAADGAEATGWQAPVLAACGLCLASYLLVRTTRNRLPLP